MLVILAAFGQVKKKSLLHAGRWLEQSISDLQPQHTLCLPPVSHVGQLIQNSLPKSARTKAEPAKCFTLKEPWEMLPVAKRSREMVGFTCEGDKTCSELSTAKDNELAFSVRSRRNGVLLY